SPPPSRMASAPSGIAGGGRGLASYQPRPGAPETTGSIPPPAPPAASFRPAPPPPPPSAASLRPAAPAPVSRPGSPGWEWDGGTPIIVGSGDTIDTLSRKYGVPGPAIMQANGITNPASVKPGHRLVIPRY